ncbi:MAG: LysE family translocator [Campylobacteraceae bacterium]|nr:LysE family translocator [Campylobacteraceae bacterium]
MDLVTSLAFLGAIIIFMATPGPGVLAVVSRALSSGFWHAVFMSIGMVAGDIIFLLFAILGLGVVAAKFSFVFIIIKFLGGIYLIYLGLKIFMAKTSHFDVNAKKSFSYIGDFVSGLLITLSNPKVIAFYIGFLPTFVDMQKLTHKDTVLVVSLVLITLSIILLAYAYFASRAKELIKKPKIQNIINKLTGSVMILVGGFLIILS